MSPDGRAQDSTSRGRPVAGHVQLRADPRDMARPIALAGSFDIMELGQVTLTYSRAPFIILPSH